MDENNARESEPDNAPRSPFFTVFIPTYNRARLLPRALRSIEQQTYPDFDVLVVDDGSNDGTDELIQTWRKKQKFQVHYIWQDNSGKHGAHNTALHHLHSQLTLIIDSDDALAPHALERLHHHWQAIPAHERDRFAGVTGLSAAMDDSNSVLGNRFPADECDSDPLEMHFHHHVGGDKLSAVRSDILRQFPFPQFEGEKHVRPSLVFRRIAQHYTTRYVNEVLQYKEYQPDGLSSDRFTLRLRNPNGFRQFFLDEITLHKEYLDHTERRHSFIKFIRYSLHAGSPITRQIRDSGQPWATLAAYPAAGMRYFGDRLRWRLRRQRKQ